MIREHEMWFVLWVVLYSDVNIFLLQLLLQKSTYVCAYMKLVNANQMECSLNMQIINRTIPILAPTPLTKSKRKPNCDGKEHWIK